MILKPKQPKAPWTRMPGAKLKQKAPRKRIKSVTSIRSKELRIYAKERKKFLALHIRCEAWNKIQSRLFFKNLHNSIMQAHPSMPPIATEVHHKYGKVGKLLLWQPGWLAVCSEAHRWITDHSEEARDIDLLCEKGQWNNQELAK